METTGWVGLGVSTNGGMEGADMAIGWVHEGQTSLQVSDKHHNGPGLILAKLTRQQELVEKYNGVGL